jgi:hypothetical protein
MGNTLRCYCFGTVLGYIDNKINILAFVVILSFVGINVTVSAQVDKKQQKIYDKILKQKKANDAVELMKELTDQNLLAELAKNAERDRVRSAAVEKLDENKWQELLADIAENDRLKHVNFNIDALQNLEEVEMIYNDLMTL